VKKVVVKILQGSVVTKPLCELTIYPAVAKFSIVYMCQNCENWLAVDKVTEKISRLTFCPPCICRRRTPFCYSKACALIIPAQPHKLLKLTDQTSRSGIWS